jgi:hypothetical protein
MGGDVRVVHDLLVYAAQRSRGRGGIELGTPPVFADTHI